MDNRRRSIVGLLCLLCVLSCISSICVGGLNYSPAQLWNALINGPTDPAGTILWFSRIPRTAACMLSGGALAVSGCILQNVLGNHLASPGIIGVNSGAGLAVTLCCAFGALSGWTIAVAAFFGALAAVMLVAALARRTGASRTTVILSGVAINCILGAMSDAVVKLVPDAGMLSVDFRVGGFSSVSHIRIIPAGILIVLAIGAVLTLSNQLDVMALGEETAKSLGLSVQGMRTLFLVLAALLAGASVSFSGLLGFVGLLVPHAVRNLVGSECRWLLPLSALGGAVFVTVCDLVSRTVFYPFELPVGILISLFGGPCFLLILLKRKGGHRNA